ncbi:MAG: nucleotidyltransferase domain-containing protein [Candidatus Eremiobacteraeota bacterium]|nr:nucleotidyltransferase domain-containing protein [Candidatus Eremiobacteraeota bacterium]
MPYVPKLQHWAVRCRQQREALDRAVDALRQFCETDPDIDAVYAFGSYASGKIGPTSDLDLLVVHSSRRDRAAMEDHLRRVLPAGVAYDLVVVTPEQYAEDLAATSFGRTILESSRLLYAA